MSPICGEPGTWEYEFGLAHDHCPNEQDRRDRDWSLAFLAEHGHPPTNADWLARWEAGPPILSEIDELRLRAERLEREVAELTTEKGNLTTIIDGIKAAVLHTVVLPNLGT